MVERSAVNKLQLPAVMRVEKLGEFGETLSDELSKESQGNPEPSLVNGKK